MRLSIWRSRYGLTPPVRSKKNVCERPAASASALHRMPPHPGAEQIHQPKVDRVRDRRRAGDRNRLAPAVASTVQPEGDPRMVDIDQVRQAVTIDIAQEHSGWIPAVRKIGGSPPSRSARPSRRGPRLGQYSRWPSRIITTSCRPSPDMSAKRSRGSLKEAAGKLVRSPRSTRRSRCHPVSGMVEEALQPTAVAQRVGDAICR